MANATIPVIQINEGNVGIGTTSPANKLVVSVSTAGDYATLINNTNSTNGYGLLARTASTGTSSYAFAARAGSSDIFVVRADGNVGIGTTSPLAKLQVGLSTSNAGNRSALAMFGAAESGILNALSLVNTTGAAATGYGTRINFHLSSNYSPTGCIEVVTEDLTSNATDSTMRFSTYGTLSGTTTYQSRLEISSAGAIKFNDYNSTKQTGTPTYLLGTDASGNIVKTNTVPGSGAGPYLPLSAGSSYPLTGDLHYNGSIRSTTPASKLILSNSSTTTELHAAGSGGTAFKDSGNNTKMVIDSSGNVGIGTTSPSEKLEVQGGNIKIDTTTNTDAKLILNPYSGTLGTTYQWELVGASSASNYNFQIREAGQAYVL